MHYRLTATALRDLAEIWEYIARDSESSADRFIDSIKERCELLAASPRSGRPCDHIRHGLRSVPFREYIIFYRVGSPGIRIMRVMHGRRDFSEIF